MQLNLRIFFRFYVKIIQIWHISKSKNRLVKEEAEHGPVTLIVWMKLGWKLEKLACVRLYELEDDDPYKKKNKSCITRDNIFSALIKRHKDGDLTIDEYHAELVKTNRDYDLPVLEQAALKASDSEEEER